MSDGMTPDYIYTNWDDNGYLMYRTENGRLFIEEYPVDGTFIKFDIPLLENMESVDVFYCEAGYVTVNQNCGEQIQSPYTTVTEMVPVYEKSLYYRGELVCSDKGMNIAYTYELSDEYDLWIVYNGDALRTENESVFEDLEYVYTLANHVFVKKSNVLYENNNSFMLSRCNNTVFLLQGNYMYAFGIDGTPYIRALHSLLNND